MNRSYVIATGLAVLLLLGVAVVSFSSKEKEQVYSDQTLLMQSYVNSLKEADILEADGDHSQAEVVRSVAKEKIQLMLDLDQIDRELEEVTENLREAREEVRASQRETNEVAREIGIRI